MFKSRGSIFSTKGRLEKNETLWESEVGGLEFEANLGNTVGSYLRMNKLMRRAYGGQACHPSTPEVEAKGSGVQGHPCLHKFMTKQGCTRPKCPKAQNINKNFKKNIELGIELGTVDAPLIPVLRRHWQLELLSSKPAWSTLDHVGPARATE